MHDHIVTPFVFLRQKFFCFFWYDIAYEFLAIHIYIYIYEKIYIKKIKQYFRK